MPAYTLEDDLSLAHRLIDVASEVALEYFRADPSVTSKADGTPVTAADVQVERRMLDLLRRERPDDAILSEEAGESGSGNRRWIIDPIDGTWNFIEGRESWGTHVALECGADDILLGVVSRPVMSARWSGAKGCGAFKSTVNSAGDGSRLATSSSGFSESTRLVLWGLDDHPATGRFKERGVWVEPYFEAILDVAEGKLAACVDATGKPRDLAPYVRIIEEAGGSFSDLTGGRSIRAGGGCFSNGHVHAAVLAALAT